MNTSIFAVCIPNLTRFTIVFRSNSADALNISNKNPPNAPPLSVPSLMERIVTWRDRRTVF